jgi:hypothetical protein
MISPQKGGNVISDIKEGINKDKNKNGDEVNTSLLKGSKRLSQRDRQDMKLKEINQNMEEAKKDYENDESENDKREMLARELEEKQRKQAEKAKSK